MKYAPLYIATRKTLLMKWDGIIYYAWRIVVIHLVGATTIMVARGVIQSVFTSERVHQ